MTFTVKINYDNAAFEPDPSNEIIRLLRVVIERVAEGGPLYATGRLIDINGNGVGWVRVVGRN